MADVEKPDDRKKLIEITDEKRKLILDMIEKGLELKKRRLGAKSFSVSSEVSMDEDTPSLKKIRLHINNNDKCENGEQPSKHEPVTTKPTQNPKCNMCIYSGKDTPSTYFDLYKCVDCKSSPVLCSLYHFDMWHSVDHNWMVIQSTTALQHLTLPCAVCREFTRFQCSACKPVVGYCSSQHFNEGHKNLKI